MSIKAEGNYKNFELFIDTFLRKAVAGDRSYLSTLFSSDNRAQAVTANKDQAITEWNQVMRANRIKGPVKYHCVGLKRCEMTVRFDALEKPMKVSFIRDGGSTGWLVESTDTPKAERQTASEKSPN
jgi:hypothetical protein